MRPRGGSSGVCSSDLTGRGEDAGAIGVYQELNIPAVVRPFFEHMGEAWRAADLAVSRAGAGGVAEAWAYRVPTLFMPNPYHRDQHQKHNAARLIEVGAARIVDDQIHEAANALAAGSVLRELIENDSARAGMLDALAGLGPADGAARIAQHLLG